MTILAEALAGVTGLGAAQALAGLFAVRHFARGTIASPKQTPPVTVLRPLCGDEPMLEQALLSCFNQDYPEFQIVFGVQDPCDPALAILRKLREAFPLLDVEIVVDPTPHGSNRKVANLINMLAVARHELLAISDSDLHLAPDYLTRLVAEMERPGMGLVTSLYVGLAPCERGWPAKLGTTHISHNFVPGVLISRALGRQDCLGSTAMFRRDTLERIGGFYSLSHLLAEDNVMGRRVRELGLSVGLAKTVPAATVPEPTIAAMWQHEMRWTRTIRALAPISIGASSLQYPLFWGLLACVASQAAAWSFALFAAVWAVRAAATRLIDRLLRPFAGYPVRPTPIWLLPLRDVISVVEIFACYWTDEVTWRGHKMGADRKAALAMVPPLAIEELHRQG